MSIICPFCGKESKSDEYCTGCNVLFNKQVRDIAYTAENDPRSDMVGPVSTKTAKRLLVVLLVGLVVAFFALTEMGGNGFSSLGAH